jgi:peptidoglycan hydrolase-like protein with peptidoglycan-binding domain
MRERFSFEREMRDLGIGVTPEFQVSPQATIGPVGFDYAIQQNRNLSQSLGWGPYLDRIGLVLNLGFTPTSSGDPRLAEAVYRWQNRIREYRISANGTIDSITWQCLRRVLGLSHDWGWRSQPIDIYSAVTYNQNNMRNVAWQNYKNRIDGLLGLERTTPQAFAQAVANWQWYIEGLHVDGKVGRNTWNIMAILLNLPSTNIQSRQPSVQQQRTTQQLTAGQIINYREINQTRQGRIFNDISTRRNHNFTLSESLSWKSQYWKIATLIGLDSFPSMRNFIYLVADWQRSNGIDETGVVDDNTWRRMQSVLPSSLSSYLERIRSNVNVPLRVSILPELGPDPPIGLMFSGAEINQYGLRSTILALQKIGYSWHGDHRSGPSISIGGISYLGGGIFRPHSSHQCGVDVDMYGVRNTGNGEVWWNRSCQRTEQPYTQVPREEEYNGEYNYSATKDLIDLIIGNGVARVERIFFNDPKFYLSEAYSNVVHWEKGHDDHLHVRFNG